MGKWRVFERDSDANVYEVGIIEIDEEQVKANPAWLERLYIAYKREPREMTFEQFYSGSRLWVVLA